MNFKEKVQSMTAKEIIMAMVTGLRKRWVEIDMSSYGYKKDGICHGCAATNTVCEIIGRVPKIQDQSKEDCLIATQIMQQDVCIEDIDFVSDFEYAIDGLRQGYIWRYNRIATKYNFSNIPKDAVDSELNDLNDDFTESDLQKYEDFANTLN